MKLKNHLTLLFYLNLNFYLILRVSFLLLLIDHYNDTVILKNVKDWYKEKVTPLKIKVIFFNGLKLNESDKKVEISISNRMCGLPISVNNLPLKIEKHSGRQLNKRSRINLQGKFISRFHSVSEEKKDIIALPNINKEIFKHDHFLANEKSNKGRNKQVIKFPESLLNKKFNAIKPEHKKVRNIDLLLLKLNTKKQNKIRNRHNSLSPKNREDIRLAIIKNNKDKYYIRKRRYVISETFDIDKATEVDLIHR